MSTIPSCPSHHLASGNHYILRHTVSNLIDNYNHPVMDRLPFEVLQRILASLDLDSLRNAALSCRTFFEAFKGAEEILTSKILLRHISYDVLPEGILVHKSWELGKPSVDKGITFAEKNLRHRELAPTKWKLANALPRLLAAGASPVSTREELCRFE
jgi:hypothetical protein